MNRVKSPMRTLTQREQKPVTEKRVKKKKHQSKQKMAEKITDTEVKKASSEEPEKMENKIPLEKNNFRSSSKKDITSTNNLQKKQTVSEKTIKLPKLSLIDRLFIRPISKHAIQQLQQPIDSQSGTENIQQEPVNLVVEENTLPTNKDDPTVSPSTPSEKDKRQDKIKEVKDKFCESEISLSDENERKRKKPKTKKLEMKGAPNCPSKLLSDRFSMTSKNSHTEGALTKRQAALEKWRQMGRRRTECERRHRERRIKKQNKY